MKGQLIQMIDVPQSVRSGAGKGKVYRKHVLSLAESVTESVRDEPHTKWPLLCMHGLSIVYISRNTCYSSFRH